MKKIALLSAAASLILVSAPAYAESSDSATVTMTGNVQQICTAVPHAGIAGQNVSTHYSTPSDDNVNVTFDFGIPNTNDPTASTIGQTNQAFFSIAFDTFCNDDFTITATPLNGAFNNPNSAPAGFTNSLPYGFTLKKIGGGSVSVNTASTTPAVLTGSAFHGTSQIDVGVKPSTTAPVAGDYSETMTITFAADAASV